MKPKVKKTCPNCGKVKMVGYKHRDGRGFCSLSCAYASRVIHPIITKQCPSCLETFDTKSAKYCSKRCAEKGYIGYRHSEQTKRKMSAAWTDEKRKAASIPKEEKLCNGCGEIFLARAYGKGSVRKFCSNNCYWEHLKTDNHMKLDSQRENMRAVAQSRSQETLDKIRDGVSKAWADGKFEGVRVGQCYWYRFVTSKGKVCKVQGAWELAFVNWLDELGLRFNSHRGKIPYVDEEGVHRHWYPDFYIHRWDCWIDIKCEHFYDEQKFDSIKTCNPLINISVLMLTDLNELGVPIYGKGGKYLPYLEEMVQRTRVQPRTEIQSEQSSLF